MNKFIDLCKKAVVLPAVGVIAGLAAPPTCWAQGAGGERIRQQETFAGANVLTPGEHDDWPLAARDGETVILSASSTDFDPAVELLGPAGQVIARNDDIRQGRQDALLLVRLATGGDYRARVTSSNRATGGRYELTVRRFVATELPIGARTTGTLGRTLARWHRVPADIDQTLVITARAASFRPLIQVYAPNGEPVESGQADAGRKDSMSAVFRAPQAGMFYARIARPEGGDPRDSYAVTAAPARVFPTAIGDPNPGRRIDEGGLDLWTFRGEAGDLIRVRAVAAASELIAHLSYLPPADASGQLPAPDGPVPPLVLLPSDPKSSGELVALVNLSGTYQVAVSQPLGVGVRYTFATSRPAQPLAKDAGTDGTLVLGGADYWTIEGTSGQVLRLEGSSDRFDPELELYGPQGTLVLRNDDGAAGRNALVTALLIERGHYFVRVHAHGDGGSGPYRLRRVPDPVHPLAVGGRGEGTVGAGGSEVWSFEGHAGQTVILGARSPDFNIRVAVYGPDAAEIAGDDDGGEGTDSLLSVRLPVDGLHTVWVTAAGGGGRYALQLIDVR